MGESFVKVLTELSSSSAGLPEMMQASFALLLTCSIWWIYFDDVASAQLKKGTNSMVTWLFTHVPLQLSIILMGVGIKKVITMPFDEVLPLKYAYLLGGAIGVCLISAGIIDSVTFRKNSELNEGTRISVRLFSGILIIMLAIVSHSLDNIYFIAGCLFVCLFQIIFDIFFSPYDLDEDEIAVPMNDFISNLPKAKDGGDSKLKRSINLEPVRKGLPNSFKKDLYFYFVEASWLQLSIALFFIYILGNVFFAGLYLMSPDSITNSTNTFAESFFFSIQTMTTIGYGALSPEGMYSNLIVTVEAAFGLIGVALITGLAFAKISRPNAKILFSKIMIHTKINGKKSISFRISNTRGNDIVEATMTLSALVDEVTLEGENIRRVIDLNLVRSKTPFFKLTWLVTHVIDQESPLFGLNLEPGTVPIIIASFTGHDGTYSNTVYAQHNYYPEDIIEDRYFADIMHNLPDGRMLIDYDKFDSLK